MGLGKFVEGVKKAVSFRKRKAPKTASGLPIEAGELPKDHARFVLCRLAFENGIGRAAVFEDLAANILAHTEDTNIVGVLWPELAPLTKEERWAVAWRVRTFILEKKKALQNS